MTRRSLHWLLLTLTFTVGQWLAVVHGTQHALADDARLVACETCAVGHASAGPSAALTPVALLPTCSESPARILLPAPRREPQLLPPSRGPPVSHA